MPSIICPSCNKQRLARLPGHHTLVSWAETYGDKPAPMTCFEADIYNKCARRFEEAAKTAKLTKAEEDYFANRSITLTTEETKLVNSLIVSGNPEAQLMPEVQALRIKITEFLQGDESHAVVIEAE